MKKPIITICLIISMLSLNAQMRLTLEECRALALEHSLGLKIARYQIAKANAEKAAMRTQFFPSLSGSITGAYLHKNIETEMTLPTFAPNPATGELVPNVMVNPLTGETVMGADGNPVFNLYAWLPLEISLRGAYLAGISLQQPLYTGGKIAAGLSMTQIGEAMAADNLDLQRANTLYETDQAYWLYVSVQEKVKLARTYTELLDKLEQRVKDAWETGMATRNEALKVAVRHDEALLQWQKAQSGLELTRMALCRLIGLPFDTDLEPADSSLRWETKCLELTDVIQVSQRPEYRLLQKNVELAREQARIVRAEFLPAAGISLGYTFLNGISIGPEKFDYSSPTIFASLKIPLFHWGEGRQKQLSARQDQEIRKAELEQNGSLILLEIEQARLNYRDACIQVAITEKALIRAEENLRVSNDNYEVGMKLLTDLLEAQAEWQNAQSENIEAKADLKLKESSWLKATGKLE